jgi:hypothetical protein
MSRRTAIPKGVLFLLRRNELRRLGGCDFWAASALALAGSAGGCGSVFILRRRAGCWDRTGAQQGRLRRLTIAPYFSAIVLSSLAGLLNPLGIQLRWQSALPATAGGQSGLLWLQYYIPRERSRCRHPNNLTATMRGLVWRLFWQSSTLSFWDTG